MLQTIEFVLWRDIISNSVKNAIIRKMPQATNSVTYGISLIDKILVISHFQVIYPFPLKTQTDVL